MRLDQILIPNSLQKKAVTKFANEGHLGMATHPKRLLRSRVWYFGIGAAWCKPKKWKPTVCHAR